MKPLQRAGLVLAALILVAHMVASPLSAQVRFDPDPAWRHAGNITELAAILNNWLDRHSDYARRPDSVTISLIDQARAATIAGQAAHLGLSPRGYFDPATDTIYLIAPWSARKERDVSILLHELTHFRQQSARNWYCPGAQEPDAYRLQEAWLAERGLLLDNINRIAIVLEAGCTPRDIHPD